MILTTSCNYSIHVIYKPTRNWGVAHCKTIMISSTTEFKIRRQLWLGALMITLLWYVAPKNPPEQCPNDLNDNLLATFPRVILALNSRT